MSDELRLPDDLAACEALLAAKPLAATGINRDELLYRAGWAAGAETARLAVVNPPPLKGWEQPSTGDPKSPERRAVVSCEANRGGITVAWSLSSAAVAASIAVMLTLQWRPSDAPNVAADPAGSPPPIAADDVESHPSMPMPSQDFSRLNTGLIALRQRAMASAWAEPMSVSLTSGDAGAPAVKTARELMLELLPPSTGDST